MTRSVVKEWVSGLGLRHQGVLLTCIRGCDTAPKVDAIKSLARAFRERILNCHCGDPKRAVSFIERFNDSDLFAIMKEVAASHDHIPHHYLMHIIHASEIIGYKDREDRQFSLWFDFYMTMCRKLHMNAETEQQMDNRLNADEESFGKAQ